MPKDLLQVAGARWNIDGWNWIHNTQLHEDAHRNQSNGAGVMTTMRTAGMNLLSLIISSHPETAYKTVMHDTTTSEQPKNFSTACWRDLTALALVGGNGSPPCTKSLTQQLISSIPAI